MGKLYRDPYGPGHITVADPDTSLDQPPTADEGRIAKVELEYSYGYVGRGTWIRCQVCPRTVCYGEPHILAVVLLESPGRLGYSYRRAHFCSRECLGRWAGRETTV